MWRWPDVHRFELRPCLGGRSSRWVTVLGRWGISFTVLWRLGYDNGGNTPISRRNMSSRGSATSYFSLTVGIYLHVVLLCQFWPLCTLTAALSLVSFSLCIPQHWHQPWNTFTGCQATLCRWYSIFSKGFQNSCSRMLKGPSNQYLILAQTSVLTSCFPGSLLSHAGYIG